MSKLGCHLPAQQERHPLMPLLSNHKGPQTAGNILEITSFFEGRRKSVRRRAAKVVGCLSPLVTPFFSCLASAPLHTNVLTYVCTRLILGSR